MSSGLNNNNLFNDKTYSDIFSLLKHHFSIHNMLKYFGSSKNLNCEGTRLAYISMNNYFINLFIDLIEDKTKIKIENIDNDNNNYICFIAKCVSYIRGSNKKYIRLRTGENQILCSRKMLEKRNSNKYGCPKNMNYDDRCPTFSYLRKKKTCKQILKSSDRTSNFFTILSELVKYKSNNNKSRTINYSSRLSKKPVNKLRSIRKTQKKSKFNYSQRKSPKIQARPPIEINNNNFNL